MGSLCHELDQRLRRRIRKETTPFKQLLRFKRAELRFTVAVHLIYSGNYGDGVHFIAVPAGSWKQKANRMHCHRNRHKRVEPLRGIYEFT
jgi:hypothetical protein